MGRLNTGEGEQAAAQTHQNSLRILVIDDEPVVGDALKLVLESNGYEVVLVETGHAGITEASNRPFDLCVIDLFLSDISGLEVIKRIKEKQPEFPVILMTGKGTPKAFSEARQLGVVGILTKPFRPVDILQLISGILNQ